MKAINIKTGDEYTIITELPNKTNAQDGQVMVLYTDKLGNPLVREKSEFEIKFNIIQEISITDEIEEAGKAYAKSQVVRGNNLPEWDDETEKLIARYYVAGAKHTQLLFFAKTYPKLHNMAYLKRAKDILYKKAEEKGDGFLTGQVSWIVEAMEEFADVFHKAEIEKEKTFNDSFFKQSDKLWKLFAEISDYQLNNVQIARSTKPYLLAMEGLHIIEKINNKELTHK